MSYYANNEYIIASNNSMNENKYNSDKMKNSGIKALLKPLLKMIKKTVTKRVPAKTCATCVEAEDNSANEALERKLRAELEACSQDAAIFVYDSSAACAAAPVARDSYIPVHFARTDAGTFFWTSASKSDGDFAAAHCYTECQTAEQQYPAFADRWVQA
ncbi:unnamed protein product [Plutella xylostella]|uniref:(diamondback moth) hypothetical protein n=1 Tax=Plutella xylostella TaxID=51655 RepID=A0A8S4EA10_PLUXY|nr:unnamed protein product [Plutella xylostella]